MKNRHRRSKSARAVAAALAIAPALSGCALLKERVRYVTVFCVTPEQYEQMRKAEPPKVHDHLTGDADKDIRPIAGSAIRLRAWGDGLLEILGGCVEPKPNAQATSVETPDPDAHALADKILDN